MLCKEGKEEICPRTRQQNRSEDSSLQTYFDKLASLASTLLSALV